MATLSKADKWLTDFTEDWFRNYGYEFPMCPSLRRDLLALYKTHRHLFSWELVRVVHESLKIIVENNHKE